MATWVVAELVGDGVAPASWEALEEAVALAGTGAVGVLAAGGAAAETALAAASGYGAGRIVLLEAPPGPPEAHAAPLAWWLARQPEAPGPDALGDPAAAAPRLPGPAAPTRPEPGGLIATAGATEAPAPDARPAPEAPARAAGGRAAAPLLVLAHTAYGRALAPRLAVALDAAVVPDAVALRRAPGGGIEATRPVHGGQLDATVRVPAGVAAVVTLRPGAVGSAGPHPGPAVAVERHRAPVRGEPRAPRRRRLVPADPETVDLGEAERIVAGGRGIGGPEGFALLQELARLLGAAVGGSRVAVDLGWLPWERQIGQSGRTVAPRLYLAFGISGASQHLAGIREADTIVAVNADPGAPILARAHLGIVADWRPVVEALVAELRARRAAQAGGAA